MRTALCLAITLAFSIGAAHEAAAADPKPEKAGSKKEAAKEPAAGKADPNGTWTWTMTTPNGQSFERKVTLKLDGGKLSGTSTGRNGDAPIEDASYRDGEVSFKLVRERNGEKLVSAFKGKVDGDVIKGTMSMSRGGGEQNRPWEARRAR